MVARLENPMEAGKLFDNWPEALIWSCLQNISLIREHYGVRAKAVTSYHNSQIMSIIKNLELA